MFTHYYRYHEKYRCKAVHTDDRLEIVYPADEHGMITKRHDFYVIGRFHGITLQDDAMLTVELIEYDSGRVVRTVHAEKPDNIEGMYAEYPGLDTQEDTETIRRCGMPDLVYDPERPESFWDTWNKAYYTRHVFSALIWGGVCTLSGRLNPCDQSGRKMQPLEEGLYEVRATLRNGGEMISSGKTVYLTDGKKEIILSRFSPESHVRQVESFAEREGFEAYVDPYAGIWDTQYFSFDWPVKAWVEMPERWHFGDAQEYETGDVHVFDYNISEAAISWKTEIGSLLTWDRHSFDRLDRIHTYYYRTGHPGETPDDNALAEMEKEHSFAVTKLDCCEQGDLLKIQTEAVCRPIPSTTEPVTECAYLVKSRLTHFLYRIYSEDGAEYFYESPPQPVGITVEKESAPAEWLLLHARHELCVERESVPENFHLEITALDENRKIWERQTFHVHIRQSKCSAVS